MTDIEQGAKAYFPLTSDSDRTWVSDLRRLNGDDKNDARDSAINSVIFINPAVGRIRGDKSVFRRAWLLNVGYDVVFFRWVSQKITVQGSFRWVLG